MLELKFRFYFLKMILAGFVLWMVISEAGFVFCGRL
jgi:uncharacterized protein YunC (DUF1805 family)